MNFEITTFDEHGKRCGSIPLTEQEYKDLERAMQWPEDLERYDRSNKPITEYDLGISVFGGIVK